MNAFASVVCPRDRTPLASYGSTLVCQEGHEYPVVDDIPVLLLEELPSNTAITESLTFAKIGGDDPLAVHEDGIHSQVSRMVAATNGILYAHLVGNLPRYPIPELRLDAGYGREFLDIGCNWGRWSFAAARKGYRVVGLDPHLHSLRAAKIVARQLGLDVTFVCGDARAMPFPDERFDVAFSYSVLQHFARADVRTTLREVARVLRNGGISFIQMPNAFGVRSAYHLARRGFSDGRDFDVRYWTPRSLKRTFAELIGPSRLSVDGFFGLGIQPADKDLLPFRFRSVVNASEFMRALARHLPAVGLVADSQYVTSTKSPPTKVK